MYETAIQFLEVLGYVEVKGIGENSYLAYSKSSDETYDEVVLDINVSGEKVEVFESGKYINFAWKKDFKQV